MSKKLYVQEVFGGYCSHENCVHNYGDECDYGEHVSEYMNYMGGDMVECKGFKLKDGYCDCGHILTETTERLPYGDTYVPHRYLKCIKCEGR